MQSKILLCRDDIQRILERLSSQLVEKHGHCQNIMLIGIQRRGVFLAQRIAKILEARLGQSISIGTLDINLYRDDWTSLQNAPHIGPSHIPSPVEKKKIILIDDVLFSGRTTRSALEALLDYGRPQTVELLVLVDRGHRELPIQADYVGRAVMTENNEYIDVLLEEIDGEDCVKLVSDLG